MTQGLLDYSRGTMKLQPQEVQIVDWLESVLRPLREDLARSQVKVATDLNYRGPARLDPDRMRRVLNNIAGNARDAMPEGGTFTVTTRVGDGFWELELKDTGRGIPQALRSRIFEPFVTSGKDHGTGLGLAIVREIIQGHGGEISVHSRVVDEEEEGHGPGTAFLITMPIAGATDS